MQPLVYSKFRMYHIDDRDLDEVEPEAVEFLGGALQRMVGIGIDEPACQMVLEDFFPGGEYHWTTWQDQVDLVTQGSAEITCYLPPSLEEKVVVVAEAPCVYLIPRGTRITWKPLGDGPFRHISIDFPNPGFPTTPARSVRESASGGSR
jgi:hypothetical protein